MLRIGIVIVSALALLATPSLAVGECTSYGEGVSLESTTQITDILAAPSEWAGKAVRVEGEVREVCAMAGCWMEIAAGEDSAALRVKVEDGVIVFPVSARGKRAAAEGVVEVREMSREEWVGWGRHLAEEQGEDFDESAIGDGPFEWVQVKATGTEVCDAG